MQTLEIISLSVAMGITIWVLIPEIVRLLDPENHEAGICPRCKLGATRVVNTPVIFVENRPDLLTVGTYNECLNPRCKHQWDRKERIVDSLVWTNPDI